MSSSSQPPRSFGSTAGKVAIPRLQRPGQAHTISKDRRRVPRACTACRSHKIKCTGEMPLCKHCATTGRECVYVLPRRDRLKIVTDRCVQMASLLNELRRRAGDDDVGRITTLLDTVEEDIAEIRQTLATPNPDTDMEDNKTTADELLFEPLDRFDPPESDSVDLVDEDLLRDDQARATGYVGKTAEVQWLRSIVLHLDRSEDESTRTSLSAWGSYAFGTGSMEQVSSFSFYMDSETIELDFYVDPYELPAPEIAERLLDCYESTVHTSFPFVPQRAFDGFRQYFAAVSTPQISRLTPKWQAILNMIFALGARYSHLVRATWQADERDHLIYHARARAFGLNEQTLTSHPDVPQIQVTGLLSLYYLSIGQISRACVIIGLALRFAYALGLHVRNEDPSTPPTQKEMFVRIWWSLYNLERLLSVISGRPSSVVDSCCSVPLPLPLAEGQLSDDVGEMDRLRKTHSSTPTTSPTSHMTPYSFGPPEAPRTPVRVTPSGDVNKGTYFKALVQIGIITQNLVTSLYSAGTTMRSAGDAQQDIGRLGQRLDQWLVCLPPDFNFQNRTLALQRHRRERMLLGFHFYSARILLLRPCLAGLGQVGDHSASDNFVGRMAMSCVDAAKGIVDFLPDDPHTFPVYENGPWWSIVHHVMQAASVVLHGLSHTTEGSEDMAILSDYVKKLIRWLRAVQDPLAGRAGQMALQVFQAVAKRLSIDISEFHNDYDALFAAPDFGAQQWYANLGMPDIATQFPGPFNPAPAADDAFITQDSDVATEFPASGGGLPFGGPFQR